MLEESSYKLPPGQRSGQGSDSVLHYLLDDLRKKDIQPPFGSQRHAESHPSEMGHAVPRRAG